MIIINLKGIEKFKKKNNNENKFKINSIITLITINFKILKSSYFDYSMRPLNIRSIIVRHLINLYSHHIYH